VWQVWLTRNEDLHGCDNDEKCKRLIQSYAQCPTITALHAKQDLLLASDKQIFELPINACMLLHSHKLEIWVRLLRRPALSKEHSPTLNSTFVTPIMPSLISLHLHGPAL
jgi:hypothetical protein